MSAVYPSIKSSALTAAMSSVGPVSEWTWLDYLSPGDVARVVFLYQIKSALDAPADVREAARVAYGIMRETARWRMAEAPHPSRAGGISVADALAGFERLRGNSANGADAIQTFSAGFAGVSPGPVDPLVLAARTKVLEVRKLYESADSDYCAGVKEACDAIGEALGMGTVDKIAENDPANNDALGRFLRARDNSPAAK